MQRPSAFALNKLKTAVMESAGFTSMIPAHCHLLSCLIKVKTGQSLSPTTLKRIYGFAASRTYPSLYTLDALAKFCGHKGWHYWQQEQVAVATFPGELFKDSGLDHLFYLGAQPMWVMDTLTLRFTEINEAAVRVYGYSRSAFLSMSVLDIRPEQEHYQVHEALQSAQPIDLWTEPTQHHCADGSIREVQILSYQLSSPENSTARLIVPLSEQAAL
jgi:PAS domain S-box-containing protein